MIQKIKKKTLRCGTTGEWYTVSELVNVVSQDLEAIEATRRANEARFDAEAAAEAGAIGRHRHLRLGVQKIGWRPAA